MKNEYTIREECDVVIQNQQTMIAPGARIQSWGLGAGGEFYLIPVQVNEDF